VTARREGPLKVLIFNWQDRLNPFAGGAETHLHEIFGRLAGRGHEVTLIASGWPGGARREEVDGIDVRRVGGRHSYSLAAPAAYHRRLAASPFDVLVEDLNKVPIFSPIWSRHPMVLLVHHLFGGTAFEEAPFPIAAATWLLEQPLGIVYRGRPTIAVSESTAADLARRGFDRERIAVIPNGVDAADFTPGEPEERLGEPTLLYLGRLKRYKRIDLILRAVALLRDRGLVVRTVVAGQGDWADELARLRDGLDLGTLVEMPGFVSEAAKREYFRRAWIHVLTSPKEGWGITNLEAAACGTPTIASDSPGLRDSVVDGETGFLVPHGDVEALAACIRRLIEDGDLRRRLGRQARAFAERFSWDGAADRMEEFLTVVGRSDPNSRRM